MDERSEQFDAAILAKVRSPAKIYLGGPFGTGKRTLATERVRWLLAERHARGDDILVLVPQPINAEAFQNALARAFAPGDLPAGAPVRIATLAQIAREAIELYWPLVAPMAGFVDPTREPTFLNVESAQYYLGRFVDEALEADEFHGLALPRPQIILQILNNLNRAALYNLSVDEVYTRLATQGSGPRGTPQLAAFESARRLSYDFRLLCLEQALVDFSLQMEIFQQHVLSNDWSRTHLLRSRQHLVAANLEEDNPVTHALLRAWIPQLESVLLCADDEAGFRSTLGADPRGAYALAAICDESIHLSQSRIMQPPVVELAHEFAQAIDRARYGGPARAEALAQALAVTAAETPGAHALLAEGGPLLLPLDEGGRTFRFFPQMIHAVAAQIARLIDGEGVPPNQIAVLAPGISDAVRFTLQRELALRGLPSAAHRPSRALEEEPAARALLTLAQLAHPHWDHRPTATDVAQALQFAIDGLDPVRAALLVGRLYSPNGPFDGLTDSGRLDADSRRRLATPVVERYDTLHAWLGACMAAGEPPPLDQFLGRLFEEVLGKPGYAYRDDVDAVRVANQMIESARALRQALEPTLLGETERMDLGAEYVHLVQSGALGALYVPAWTMPADAVLIAPVASFLLRNEPVDCQVWLDVGSPAWAERVQQTLTHPGLLTHHWPAGKRWEDSDEFAARQESLRRQVLGLLRRTRKRVYLALSEYSESGYEQRGPLPAVINRVLAQRAEVAF